MDIFCLNDIKEDDLLSFIKENIHSEDFILKIISRDQLTGTSIIADILKIFSIHTVENIILILKNNLSRYNIKKILHYDPLNLHIPFNKHPVSVCYEKYGIENTKIFLSRHYDQNPLFITLPLDDNKSILEIEDEINMIIKSRELFKIMAMSKYL